MDENEGTYAEEDVSNLEDFVKSYVKEEHAQRVINRLYRKLQYVLDYEDNMREVLTKKTVDKDFSVSKKGGAAAPPNQNDDSTSSGGGVLDFCGDDDYDDDCKKDTTETESFYSFDKDVISTLSLPDKQFSVEVPGVILAYDSNVLKTEAVVVDALLGQGEALDGY